MDITTTQPVYRIVYRLIGSFSASFILIVASAVYDNHFTEDHDDWRLTLT